MTTDIRRSLEQARFLRSQPPTTPAALEPLQLDLPFDGAVGSRRDITPKPHPLRRSRDSARQHHQTLITRLLDERMRNFRERNPDLSDSQLAKHGALERRRLFHDLASGRIPEDLLPDDGTTPTRKARERIAHYWRRRILRESLTARIRKLAGGDLKLLSILGVHPTPRARAREIRKLVARRRVTLAKLIRRQSVAVADTDTLAASTLVACRAIDRGILKPLSFDASHDFPPGADYDPPLPFSPLLFSAVVATAALLQQVATLLYQLEHGGTPRPWRTHARPSFDSMVAAKRLLVPPRRELLRASHFHAIEDGRGNRIYDLQEKLREINWERRQPTIADGPDLAFDGPDWSTWGAQALYSSANRVRSCLGDLYDDLQSDIDQELCPRLRALLDLLPPFLAEAASYYCSGDLREPWSERLSDFVEFGELHVLVRPWLSLDADHRVPPVSPAVSRSLRAKLRQLRQD